MAKRRPARVSPGYISKSDEALIELARKRFHQAEDAETKQREREREDLAFYAGEQWPQDVLDSREGIPGNAQQGIPPVPARPSLTINKVREPVRQVLNQERQSDLGVEIAAANDFGDGSPGISPEEIELREGLVRKIQRESQAADARSWAFSRATIAGRGYYSVMTRYVAGKSFDQELYVHRLYNQASVLLDPAHEQPDGSDAEWGFIGIDMPWETYKSQFPKIAGNQPNPLLNATAGDWRAIGDELPGWFTVKGELKSVRVVEYWRAERETIELVQLQSGEVVNAADLADDAQIAVGEDGEELRRQDMERKIIWTKLDGVQVLDETAWEGHYIPIVKVLGEELQPYDSQRRAEGMVRPARDSQKAFNAMISKWVEQVGLAPIPPWMGPAGFDEGFEKEYALSTTRTLPALHYNTKGFDGQPIQEPTRTSITMAIEAIAGSIQVFDQAIKSTTQVPDITNLDPKITSDRQLKRVLTQSQAGTSHFLDNLSRSIRYEGLILNDLLYPIYGRPGRMARMMTPDGDTKPVLVGQLAVPHPDTGHPQTQIQGQSVTATTPNAVQYRLTPDATFNVTVKVTKNYDTRREQQEDTLAQLVQADPQQMAIVGDLLFKYNDGPGHQELEERYKAMLAPAVQQAMAGKTGPDLQLQQAMAKIQQLEQMIQTKTAERQVEGQFDLQKATIDSNTRIKVAQIQQEGAFAVADLKAGLEAANTAIAAMQAERLSLEAAAKMSHEGKQNALDRAHEAGLAAQAHGHDLVTAALEHQQGLEAGDQAHQQGLEANAQQAALQPAPDAGAVA